MALMPLVYPMAKLDGVEFDRYLALGRRRSSSFLYHTACPSCSACEPARVLVEEFVWTDSMKRVLKRGDRELRIVVDLPKVDQARVDLFNAHRLQRGLGKDDELETVSDYGHGFVETCCDSIELSFWKENRLVGVSIVDCGQQSVSAVYTFSTQRKLDCRSVPIRFCVRSIGPLLLGEGISTWGCMWGITRICDTKRDSRLKRDLLKDNGFGLISRTIGHEDMSPRTCSSSTGWMIPFSVMMPVINSAGVTSNAGL